jgi:hypothetical protein
MINSSQWSASEKGKLLQKDSLNGGKQIRPAFQDLLGAGLQLGLGPHRQRVGVSISSTSTRREQRLTAPII